MVSLALPQSALQNWLRPERSGQLAKLVNILLVVWLAWMLASLSWSLLPQTEQPQTVSTPGPAVAPAAQADKPRFDEKQIASWHVFGVADQAEPDKKPVLVEDAPDTRLKLILKGVFATEESDVDNARAIVADPKGQEETYSIGDPVPGGAKLSQVHPDRVILERNGRYETLRLPKDDDMGVASARTVSHSRAQRVNRGTSNSGASRAQAFNRYRNEIKRNPATFLNYVRATPAREGSQFVGFKLQPGRDPEAMEDLGLEAGDVVTAINGVQIESPASGMKAMQALGEGENVDVTLLREGQEMSITLSLPAEN